MENFGGKSALLYRVVDPSDQAHWRSFEPKAALGLGVVFLLEEYHPKALGSEHPGVDFGVL